ncbi:MAG: glutamine--fructose-6-phosphate transaminase (isomerizing) [Coriobacteriales bacterium]|jgi:glucosamine--fructose-6-phosphate aminotransferase (isomerizing)|nr:glutamine--fructose-6-phosphate transaminase (isomerizing) [Coriobacteriales bacterium]
MCGIVAFTGTIDAVDVLLGGLRRLEYRGYDSAGVALVPRANELICVRRKGKVAQLAAALGRETAAPGREAPVAPTSSSAPAPAGTTGIGHTRWATHGVPSEANAHPHRDCSGKLAVVHNGIIENHTALRAELVAAGHTFASQTDTEVAAHLIEHYYQGNLAEAVRQALQRLSGSFALAAVHAAHPDRIVVTRNDAPLVLGSCAYGALAASDTPALLEHTRDVIYLGDRDLAVLHADGRVECYDPAGSHYVPTQVRVEWSLEQAERGGYPDFMLKEIHEQPRVLRDTISGRFAVENPGLVFEELPFSDRDFANLDRIQVIACGTSYHAGLIGRNLIEAWARLPVDVEVASEFRYRDPIVTPRTLVIAISQSGETADTLEAVKLARRAGAFVVGLTNVVGSRITLEANAVIYIKANLEVAVAATKSFLGQVAMLTLLALHLGYHRGFLSTAQVSEIYADIQKLPAQIEEILADTTAIERCAEACKDAQTVLFIGRGVGATTCYEGALKLKEISYLHAEAFSAGEIKHGPIALIDPDGLDDPTKATPVVVVAAQSATYDKTLANIEEVIARGARVVALATAGDKRIAELTERVISIPPVRECLSPILASVPLQLFARAIACARGCDVDQPRNLAKSVTVE